MTSASVQLHLGMVPAPAPLEIAQAFESMTVTQTDAGVTSGWQVQFRAHRTPTPATDYELVAHPLLQPFGRVVASVSIGSTDSVLLDGVITHLELTPSQQGAEGMLTITGDSVDTLLDLKDFTIPWPAVTDAGIVELVLAKYAAVGLLPLVVPPVPPPEIPDPLEDTVVQNESDGQFVRRLASNYGFVFSVIPGPTVGLNTAYWGPPQRFLPPQKALSVNLGSATNVNSLSFAYEAKGPTLVFGAVQSEHVEGEFPIVTTEPTRLPPLASDPAIVALLPYVDYQLYDNPAFEPGRALYEANATTQTSTDHVVTASGAVDTVRYGTIIDVPGVIGVRGAGLSYDGDYYVQSVTHNLRVGSYTQEFVLTREGTGTLTGQVVP